MSVKSDNKVDFIGDYISVKEVSTSDINKATQKDFETINGIGEVLSERILKYRKKLQGYSYSAQLYEVWGLDKETANSILKIFKSL